MELKEDAKQVCSLYNIKGNESEEFAEHLPEFHNAPMFSKMGAMLSSIPCDQLV